MLVFISILHVFVTHHYLQLILVGEKGSKINAIVTEARREIQTLLNTAVDLVLIPICSPKKFEKLAYDKEEDEE